MSVFVIADLHLSTASETNKSMEVFGNRWTNYQNKIKSNWNKVITAEDTVVIPGDISWATTLEEAYDDLSFIDSLPGKKIIGKGNHDFWWSTVSKMTRFLEENKLTTISFLFNNAYVAENLIICGTRGWFYDTDNAKIPENSDYDRLISRETARLKLSLDSALKLKEKNPGSEIVAFLHFPPLWNDCEVEKICDTLADYGISRCYFGHIHGNYNTPPYFEHKGVEYILISSDYLDFLPRIIPPVN